MPRRYLLSFILTLTFAVCAGAQGRPLWQVGEFDGSSDEFGTQAAGPFDAAGGQAKNWGATQQAVVEAKGEGTAARRIRFELADAPNGIYRLRLGLIMTSPRLPVVQVEVNGRRGRFYQRPESYYKEGNVEPYIFPQYAIGSMTLDVPVEFLRRGANEIALTAVADPLTAELPGGEETTDALLRYDALAFERVKGERAAPGVASAEATPTVFYRREGGRLSEVVSVVVSWSRLTPKGPVTLGLPGWSRTQEFASGLEFGEQRLEFLVPEFAAGARANVKVNAGGRDYDFPQTLTPRRKWTVYMVPHEHLDVGYSDFQTKLAEMHSRVIDEAVHLGQLGLKVG